MELGYYDTAIVEYSVTKDDGTVVLDRCFDDVKMPNALAKQNDRCRKIFIPYCEFPELIAALPQLRPQVAELAVKELRRAGNELALAYTGDAEAFFDTASSYQLKYGYYYQDVHDAPFTSDDAECACRSFLEEKDFDAIRELIRRQPDLHDDEATTLEFVKRIATEMGIELSLG